MPSKGFLCVEIPQEKSWGQLQRQNPYNPLVNRNVKYRGSPALKSWLKPVVRTFQRFLQHFLYSLSVRWCTVAH